MTRESDQIYHPLQATIMPNVNFFGRKCLHHFVVYFSFSSREDFWKE